MSQAPRKIEFVKYYVLAASYFPRESIIASTELNFCVRNENRCDLGDKPPKHNIQQFFLVLLGAGRNPPVRTEFFKTFLQKLEEGPERVSSAQWGEHARVFRKTDGNVYTPHAPHKK